MGEGARLRFLQARYMLECRFSYRFAGAARPALDKMNSGIIEAATNSMCKGNVAGWDYYCDKLETVPEISHVTQIRANLCATEAAQFRHAFNNRPHLYRGTEFDIKEQQGLIVLDGLANQMGLDTTWRWSRKATGTLFVAPSLQLIMQRGGTFLIALPTHTVLLQGDPATSTYRFFDPNFGIVRMDDPMLLADNVGDYIEAIYGPRGPNVPSSLAILNAHVEVPINQNAVSTGERTGEGLCAAMTLHVAKSLLENTDQTTALTAQKLGLEEFDEIDRLSAEAAQALARGHYEEAYSTTRLVLGKHFKRLARKDPSVASIDCVNDAANALRRCNNALQKTPNHALLNVIQSYLIARQKRTPPPPPSTPHPQTLEATDETDDDIETNTTETWISISELKLRD